MDKKDVAVYLCKLGFPAQATASGITVYTRAPMWWQRKQKIRNILRSVGYKGKWRWEEVGKDEFTAYLRDKGYDAINDKGCVTVLVPEITKQIQREIKAYVKACDYDKSYGWREVKTK